MKAMKYLSMVLLMFVTSVCMFSCSDDDEPTADSLVGTRWSYTELYSDGSVEQVFTFFDEGSASLVISVRNAGGIVIETETINYEYRRSEDLVIFTAVQAGKANMEGIISSNIKMDVTNKSTNTFVGTFYKQ
ncbi:hypothetical protein H9625_15215 [Phocaeicola sp. Sa1CVN1]|uniref:Lipocalin-like domain-containing protein n=1 Tax=Phocaeicola intestinalis TaxID=2762212 RepID=A0ABR8YC16_9BACT|nr:hypothetical protein [Phocaeicola intestinalis]MBD8041761.1 hypothetical protein [Phocaeicola intestinalis]